MTVETDDLLRAFQDDPVFFANEVLGVQPWAKQEEVMYAVRDNRYVCVRSGHNTGKLLELTTPIPTPTGWTTMGEIRVGDRVFDEAGVPCNVTFVSEITTDAKCYELEFSDGTKVVAGEEHNWFTLSAKERRDADRKGVQRYGSVRTTKEIAETLESENRGRNHAIPTCGPLQLPDADLPLDPYVLGMWLGNGHTGLSNITNMDAEVWEEIHRRGFESYHVTDAGLAETRRVATVSGVPLVTLLRSAGVSHDKHVPSLYFRASRAQRLDLLQGLMDSDGTGLKNGAVEFTNSNRRLSEAVYDLAVSLGLKPVINTNKSMLNGREYLPRHRVYFTPHFRVFKTERRAAPQDRRRTKSQWTRQRMIVAARPVPSVPTRCISVDSPNRLYLCTRAMIPTHNTFIAAAICRWFVTSFPNSLVITTANGWAQVKGVLWEEIRRQDKSAIYPIGGQFKPAHPDFRFAGNWMFGFSPDKTDAAQGHHRDNILIVFDEAQGIDDVRVWDAFSSMMTSGNARWLVIGNPLYPHGPYRQRFNDPNWKQLHISCLDHPNYTNKFQVVPGALTYEAIEEIRRDPLRGPGTMYWDTRIVGQFPAVGPDQFVSEALLRRAMNLPAHARTIPGRFIGFDCAAQGEDKSVVAVLVDGRLVHMEEWRYASPAKSVNNVLTIAAQYNVPVGNINFDAIGGVGGSIRKAFEDARAGVHPVFLGQPPVGDWEYLFSRDAKFQFINRRAELHWALRCLLEQGALGLDARYFQWLVSESCELKFGFMEDGKLYMESKDKKFRPRTGYSPDHNDALVLALARDNKTLDLRFGASDLPHEQSKYGPNHDRFRTRS